MISRVLSFLDLALTRAIRKGVHLKTNFVTYIWEAIGCLLTSSSGFSEFLTLARQPVLLGLPAEPQIPSHNSVRFRFLLRNVVWDEHRCLKEQATKITLSNCPLRLQLVPSPGEHGVVRYWRVSNTDEAIVLAASINKMLEYSIGLKLCVA